MSFRTITHAHEEVALSQSLRSPNLLLIGPDGAIRTFLTPLMASLVPPVVSCDGATCEFPNTPIGSLVIRDVARLTRARQEQLLVWLCDPNQTLRVIATSAKPVFPYVQRGLFSDALYYRINTLTLTLNRRRDVRRVGHDAQGSPESQALRDTA
jgi:hypothetical protein